MLVYDFYPVFECFAVIFFLPETEENKNILHGVISLAFLWSLYIALIKYSPIFQSWDGFTHHPIANATTYTSSHKNLDL